MLGYQKSKHKGKVPKLHSVVLWVYDTTCQTVIRRCNPKPGRRHSVVGTATGYVIGRAKAQTPAETRFYLPAQKSLEVHSSSFTLSIRVFPVGKAGAASY
jgi:hypothetical protein